MSDETAALLEEFEQGIADLLDRERRLWELVVRHREGCALCQVMTEKGREGVA